MRTCRPCLLPLLLLGFLSTACVSVPPGPTTSGAFEHGVATGYTEDGQAVVWVRASQAGTLKLIVSEATFYGGLRQVHTAQTVVDAAADLTGKWVLSGLRPGTSHRYKIEGVGGRMPHGSITGRFVTPPTAQVPQAVTVAWGADVAGQNICRHLSEGFPIFSAVSKLTPDLFIGAGDMIYADDRCRSTNLYGDPQIQGPREKATDLESYRAHWRYVRGDENLRRLLSEVAYLPVWDDHEVVNNFGPLHDTRDKEPYETDTHLLPLGLAAFIEYNPIAPAANTPKRIYRKLRWGRHLELYLLDTRQYRDHNYSVDSKEQPKTMLGREQLVWLEDGLAKSDATWKVIVSSLPLAVPTAYTPGRQPDAWANGGRSGGFERELLNLVHFAHRSGVKNMLWLTGDVHMGAVFRYRPIADDQDFVFYEAISGPLHAKVFGNRTIDPTLNPERLYIHAPEDFNDIKTYQQAKQWWNFGLLQIDSTGDLDLSLRNVKGEPVYVLSLVPK